MHERIHDTDVTLLVCRIMQDDQTALILASQGKGNLAVVQALLAAQVDLDAKDDVGVLELAARGVFWS